MLPALILALAALAAAALRLWAYRRQLLQMARLLEETPAESNLQLTVGMPGAAPRRLCRAVNRRLEEGRQLRLAAAESEKELKYTMACIFRTPLAGALGYLELLEGEPERQQEYLAIVKGRLKELGGCWTSSFSTPGCGAGPCRWTAARWQPCRPCGRPWRSSTPSSLRRGSNRSCGLRRRG